MSTQRISFAQRFGLTNSRQHNYRAKSVRIIYAKDGWTVVEVCLSLVARSLKFFLKPFPLLVSRLCGTGYLALDRGRESGAAYHPWSVSVNRSSCVYRFYSWKKYSMLHPRVVHRDNRTG